MDVTTGVWAATIGVLVVVLGADLFAVSRRPHRPSMREATAWVLFYIALAIVFGVVVGVVWGQQYAGEFFAGWLTEYSLSLDNLFVFVIIMSRFRVPPRNQQTVLLIGIVLALVLRGIFIALGAAVIARFSWVFYLFGAFLLWTAWGLATHTDEEEEFTENILLRTVKRVVPTSSEFDGVRLRTVVDGQRVFTPMLVVMVAIGTTDLLFALDSIPAIFGLTQEAYLVFTANAFALMGLMQLFFLLGGLLDRLVYLAKGLAVILGFIGVKLILEALHTNSLPFINGGEPVEWAPEIPIAVSLGVIVVVLAATTVASLLHTRQRAGQG
jgi:tellurite resistance protein TerC